MKHNGKDIIVKYLPFPESVQGYCSGLVTECDTRYIVAIDSTRSKQKQRHTLGHELAHIYLNHFSDRSIAEQEREANSKAWHYYRIYKEQLAT